MSAPWSADRRRSTVVRSELRHPVCGEQVEGVSERVRRVIGDLGHRPDERHASNPLRMQLGEPVDDAGAVQAEHDDHHLGDVEVGRGMVEGFGEEVNAVLVGQQVRRARPNREGRL